MTALHFYFKFISIIARSYVKEFVHGDLGRTRPNLNLLLSRLPAGPDSEQPPEKRLRHSPTGDGHSSASADVLQCDILKLDVIQVDLIWPPSFSFRS